ncbi:MAG: gliding motility-associated C-terminal domain-containing protein [Sphingobacteriales bacterium]|nr:MAG: gliding motility-associated C-terminal domain-containing protein [Sphingobacteriales bacterium]
MKKHFLLLLLLVLVVSRAYAAHYAAADMYVTYIGKNADGCSNPEYKYEVMLILYGACEANSPSIGVNQSLRYRSDNAGAAGAEQIVAMTCVDDAKNPVPAGFDGKVVHQLCPNFDSENSCLKPANNAKYPAFKKWMYRVEVTLPSPQTDWKFYWFSGDRNDAILNLDQTFGSRNLYIESGINNLAEYNICTPRFGSNPLPYICVNTKTKYLNDPYDIQKKDTTVKLITTSQDPLKSATERFGYLPGFSSSNPIASGSGYNVDPETGTAEFTGTQTGFFVLAFQLRRMRQNQLLSYTMRDVQVAVLDCTKEAPEIDTVPQSLQAATWRKVADDDSGIYVCPGSEMSFSIRAKTATAGNKVYIRSNDFMIPGSSFTVDGEGTEAPVGTFKWTPPANAIGDYTLILSANDSSCTIDQPIVLKSPSVFLIKVVPGLNAGDDQLYCLNDKQERQLYVSGTHNYLSVQWSDPNGGAAVGMDNPQSIAPRVSVPDNVLQLDYVVKTPDLAGTCKVSDDVSLKADMSNTLTISPKDRVTVMCKPDYLQLEAVFKGEPPLQNMPCGINRSKELSEPTLVDISGSLALGKGANYDTLGFVTPYFPNATKTAKQQYLISKIDRANYGMLPGTLRSIGFEVVLAKEAAYKYSNFKIQVKCTPKNELDKNRFEAGLTTVYTATEPVTLPVGWHEFKLDNFYNWDSSQNLVIQICYSENETTLLCDPPILRFVPTTYTSRLLYIPLDGAKKPDPNVADVCAAVNSADIVSYYNRPLFRFNYSVAPAAPIKYEWSAGELLSDSTISAPLAYVQRSTRYVVQSLGGNGCKLKDSIDIYIPERNYKVTPSDSAVCYGSDAVLKVAGGGAHYKWYEYNEGQYKIPDPSALDCFNCREVRVRPLVTTNYRVVVYDSVWCTDTIDAKVKVLPLPAVKLLNKDTVIRYGASIPLLATGARQYNWLPSGSLSTPNTSSPMATPTERTQYVVMGVGANGCRSYDTVTVDVNKRENVYIPTAFSPNGDGKNDVFRVANMTFQGLMEFRIFNRWGQEIFSTTDMKGGWDGTWNGEPQPVGNYRYVIKLAQGDGKAENYTGDVTLVR